MQTDGNFVIYDFNLGARWATDTYGHPNISRLEIQLAR